MGSTVYRQPGALVVAFTDNKKVKGNLSCPVHTTYAGSLSCPSDCVFKDNGCYGENWPLKFTINRINVDAPDALEIARREAAGIRLLPRFGALRLHSFGDCASPEAAEIVSGAADEWVADGGLVAWSYTHKCVPRRSWGGVSILRSCETPDQVKQAATDGYAAAIVLTHFPTYKKFQMAGLNVIPCPEQVDSAKPKAEQKGISCADCRLCWKDQFLLEKNLTIGFSAHGTKTKRVQGVAFNPDLAIASGIAA